MHRMTKACKIPPEVREAVLGLLERQFRYIILDPYANAFNREANDRRNHLDDSIRYHRELIENGDTEDFEVEIQ